MSKNLRGAFAAMSGGNARRYQMSQKASKEQMPALIAELANRSNNVKSMKVLKDYIVRVEIDGSQAVELGMAINWLDNVIAGEDKRCAEIKALLPEHDVEIDMTKPTDPEPPAEPAPAVAVGDVELQKGEPVLGAV